MFHPANPLCSPLRYRAEYRQLNPLRTHLVNPRGILLINRPDSRHFNLQSDRLECRPHSQPSNPHFSPASVLVASHLHIHQDNLQNIRRGNLCRCRRPSHHHNRPLHHLGSRPFNLLLNPVIFLPPIPPLNHQGNLLDNHLKNHPQDLQYSHHRNRLSYRQDSLQSNLLCNLVGNQPLFPLRNQRISHHDNHLKNHPQDLQCSHHRNRLSYRQDSLQSNLLCNLVGNQPLFPLRNPLVGHQDNLLLSQHRNLQCSHHCSQPSYRQDNLQSNLLCNLVGNQPLFPRRNPLVGHHDNRPLN